MSLSDKARQAREKADQSGDPNDEALAVALEQAEAAEAQRMIREQFPMQPADPPPPPWSAVSERGTSEGPIF